MRKLCDTCVKRDNSCPIWTPGYNTNKCVEYKDEEDYSEELSDETFIQDESPEG